VVPDMCRTWRLPRALWLVVLLTIIVPVMSQAGSIPHTHSSASPAFFNQDHDRILLAASNAVATGEPLPLVFTLPGRTFVSACTSDPVHWAVVGTTDSRAPPLF
jgi:hypothetical protein